MKPVNQERRLAGQTGLMRQHFLRHFVVVMVLIWIFYTGTSFRNPLTPILLTDENMPSAPRQIMFTAAAGCSLLLMFLTKNIGSSFSINRSVLLLIILVPASTFWSTDKALTIKRTVLFLFAITTLFAVIYSSPKPVEKMLRIVISSVALVAFLSLFVHFAFGQAYTVNPGRPGLAGTSTHPNNLAPLMSIAFIFSLAVKAKSLLGLISLRGAQFLTFLALILTVSITTIFATLLAMAVYSLLALDSYKRGLQHIMIVFVVTVGSIIGWGTLKSAAFQAVGRDESLSGRDEVWKIVLVEGLKNPVFGNGFGAFWTEGKGRELVQTWNPRQSHNAYLDLWVDLGVVGLVIMLFAYPGVLFFRWSAVRGPAGSDQRRAMSALYACSISYLTVYAFAQSYFLRFDTFTFLTLSWVVLLVGNTDQNRVENEFSQA